ncbi:MAG: D-aminoacyl-tRNA deacylase [Pseudomonadota bacterium]
MIALIQRVSSASVEVENQCIASINSGILLLLAVELDDTEEMAKKMAKKVCQLRIFSDKDGKMNLSLLEKQAELLVVSQFTLAADLRSGNRPSFSLAASPERAKQLYEFFVRHVSQHYLTCQHGQFAADMKVHLVNDGPVTFNLRVN